ncbi:TraR/DksA family transcriptional regulator [Pseudomonas aeruginosa]|uniref:DksA/TraR family transcriptional regulator n=1 Tax=Pseudomonas phage vB_Pae_LC3I3 TaxID=2961988 RepID=A0A976SUU6_9CAUD|nr:TraR/DksA family transcriptional regulator [Pseudomonas aeruginosa]YP_010773450.1 DksA/TraR family transcriptional regulator [Pseudomonas phage vB_Pae_LC3I3]MBG3943927.1 TraR/DksA family transcriptional regulator [Pseudomonas aeruginosa]MBH3866999.1 TraR/DksA family transcriptional regulator [Pseudomonas aeruginosa]MBH4070908.1 TraR/DksA family transcriptional regulator [Pseudomonas aeruginosa]MBH9160306.1 TraR/DksA family transcriptional regulator [Pseudomonas aeruginosa]MBV5565658.1 TraR
MSDIVDLANDYAERELAERLYSRVKYVGESLHECEDCGEEIPVARRALVHGVRKCLSCQEYLEAINGR